MIGWTNTYIIIISIFTYLFNLTHYHGSVIFSTYGLLIIIIIVIAKNAILTQCPVLARQIWRSSCSSRPSPPAARRWGTPAAHTSWSLSTALWCLHSLGKWEGIWAISWAIRGRVSDWYGVMTSSRKWLKSQVYYEWGQECTMHEWACQIIAAPLWFTRRDTEAISG